MMVLGPDVCNSTTLFIFRYVSTNNNPVQKVMGLPSFSEVKHHSDSQSLTTTPKNNYSTIKSPINMLGPSYLVTWALYTSPSAPSVGKARPKVSRLVVAEGSK